MTQPRPVSRPLSPATVRLLSPKAAAALTTSGCEARDRRSPERARTAECEARIQSGRQQRSIGRTRIMAFDLVLTQASGAVPVFRAGPFDELRLFQRAITTRHDTEWLQRAAPGDLSRERFQPFAVFRLTPARALPVAELGRSPRLVATLKQVLGPDGVLAPRRWLATKAGDERGCSSAFARPGAAAPSPALLEAARAHLDDGQRIAWLESAFTVPPAGDAVVHRYYLGSHLGAYLVRHDARGKQLFVAEPAAAARGQGLIVYLAPQQRAA
jgi:hypothetical protein